MSIGGGLLEKACEGVLALELPACIKNSQLHYICVNDAYARFCGKNPEEFLGRTTSELFGNVEDTLREDKERRCLVFSTEEIAACSGQGTYGRHTIKSERFETEDGALFLYEVFETMPAFRQETKAVAPGQDEKLQDQYLRDDWLFREALERLPVAVFVLDSERRLAYANACFESFLNGKREAYYGLRDDEMCAIEGDRFRRENTHILETGEELHKTDIVLREDGTSLPTLNTTGRLTSPSGERYLIGSITDTTLLSEKKKELLSARKEAEKLHGEVQSILQSLPVGVMLLGPDLTIEYANNCFYDLWEVEEKVDLIGKPYRFYLQLGFDSGKYDVGHAEFEEFYKNRIARLNAIDGYTSREVESKAGKFTILSKRRLAGDKILITFADSTAVRSRDREIDKTRQELQRVGAYMQDATRVMAQGLVLIDKGQIIMSNDAIARMFDVPPEMFAAGAGWASAFRHCAMRGDFGNPQEAEETHRLWSENIAHGRPFSSLIHVAGHRWLNLEATIGAGNYWLVIVTDVTDMKQREAELETLLARAKAADKAKSEFLANMSHEIRTPMNGVLGMAELLANSPLDTRQRTFTDVIVKSGNALMTIINDILDFSKIDAGQMVLRSAPFDTAEAVEDVASLLSSQALNKDIELIIRIDPSLDTMVSGDAGRFRQIVTNLVGNAIKFTEQGHVLIHLSSEPVDDCEIMVTLRVEDTGVGIPPGQMDRIFEKFSQVDATSTRRHEGTGLGLAISMGLAGLLGGKMDVESEIGKGSIFTVTLPFRSVVKNLEQATTALDTKKVSVLIIDDNATSRKILTEQMTGWGIDSYAAEDGATGLAILKEATTLGFEIDAVILDSHMPGLSGLQVAEHIRGDHSLDKIAIVFLTSMDAIHSDQHSSELQMEAHLMKPVRARLLRKTLMDVIRRTRLKRALDNNIPPAKTLQKIERSRPSSVSPRGEDTRPLLKADNGGSTKKHPQLDVLIAEDNDVNQIVFTQILQQTGLVFRIVSDGKQAVEAWERECPAVILMDISMPTMNGHQAARAIRAAERVNGKGKRVPIIGVTAHAQESDHDQCLAAGMDDYLSKPISPELLQSKINKWLFAEAKSSMDIQSLK